MDEITITLPNQEKKVYPKNTVLDEIVKKYAFLCPNPILGVKVNGDVVPMHTKMNKSATLSFIDITSPYGYRMYQAALKFIFEVSLKETVPDSEVRFLHSVPKGIMCELFHVELTKELVSKIKGNMAKIIQNDEKIVRYNVEKKEAILYFRKTNQPEKAQNILNTDTDIVRFYKLKNYYNYYYTNMPYHTNCINQFDIKLLENNRLVLVYPNPHSNGKTPEYVHYENIIATFFEGQEWLKKMHTPYLSNLNEEVSRGKIEEFISASELLFNESIFKVAQQIEAQGSIKMVLIAGPSSTGKTTTNKRLARYLQVRGYDPIPISVDDYYKDRDDLAKEQTTLDLESLSAIDTELFNQDLNALLNHEEVHLPIYDFIVGKKARRKDAIQMKENSILLIEGLHGLNEELTNSIPEQYKFKIYLSPFIPLGIDRHNYVSTVDLRLLRRIVRDNRTRGSDVGKTIELWQKVREGEEKNIFPFIPQANVIINTAYAYEIGVLKVFVEPLLYSVDITSPYYEEARRLIDSLRGFYPISSEYVSKDSILREFIG